ncbi:MAG: GGDEF domain-containing protein [Betaproteobacteria bacterium]|nr:GGDEF domain-containing protein [Betaproteobacteria bacterium]MDE2623274.1 GGDEF domain-containing protein [Betaproteobacteria bacterium]
MSLDIHTILVTLALLAFMLSGLLGLASLHAGNMSTGIRLWAFSSLFTALGFVPAYVYRLPVPGYGWGVAIGASLLLAALGLQYLGIRSFLGKPSQRTWVIGWLGLAIALNFWLCIVQPNVTLRTFVNSLLYGAGSLACARALLVPMAQPQRTAYWLTGASFTVLGGMLLLRAGIIALAPEGQYGLFVSSPLNTLAFFLASIVQLCVTFGFVLMVNYRLIADVQQIASRDMLTDAFTRRRLEEEAQRLLAHCGRTGDMMAVMMIDVDHFKSVNDRYGHPVGDEVLRRLADVAQHSIRTDDYFARYGGEEFCILMLSTTEQEAQVLAERLRVAYAAALVNVAGHAVKSTISIGVADTMSAGLDWHKLVSAADRALYRAKQQGRNQVVPFASLELALSA